MCVIIDKEPGKLIPGAMLDTACDINKHGFGLSWVTKGKIETIRDIVDNDPKVIADLLQKHKAKRLLLHLRHATKGKVIQENSHPFVDLDKQLGFMHNGTLLSWAPENEDYSDSKCFFDGMVAPLARMARKYSGPDYLIKNYTFRTVLKDYCTGMSVFIVFDGLGNSVRYGERHGKQFEGFWASNEYSFQTSHHRSSAWGQSAGPFGQTRGGGNSRGTQWYPNQNDLPGDRQDITSDGGVGRISDFFHRAHAALALNKIDTAVDDRNFQCTIAGGWIVAAVSDKSNNGTFPQESIMVKAIDNLRSPRKTFVQQAGLKSIWDIAALSEKDLVEMCAEYPRAGASAIIDLLSHLRRLEVMSKAGPSENPPWDDAIPV